MPIHSAHGNHHVPVSAEQDSVVAICPSPTTDTSLIAHPGKTATKAEHITRLKDGVLSLKGDVHILRDKQYIRGTEATIDESKGIIEVSGVDYTRCPVDNRVWRFTAKRIVINHKKNYGFLYHGVLYFYKVPVFYLPAWWFVPDKSRRATQFLPPEISRSKEDGFTLQEGLFINLAPHYDLTLGVHFIEERGPAWYAEFNYNKPDNVWRVYASDLERDRLEERLVRRGDRSRVAALGHRGLYHLSHNSASSNGIDVSIDYTRLNDPFFGDDFGLVGIKSSESSYVAQRAQVRWQNPEWDLRLGTSSDQAINDGSTLYRLEPDVAINYRHAARPFRPEYAFQMHYTKFNHPQSGFDEGWRARGNVTIAYPMRWTGFELRPWLGWRTVRQQRPDESSYSVSGRSGGIDARLRFERDTLINTANEEKRYRHTLEPRLFYLYHRLNRQDTPVNYDTRTLEFTSEQVFRETRLSGYDLLDDTEHLGVGIGGTIASLQSGETILQGSINQIFYAQDRFIHPNRNTDTRSYSPVATSLKLHINTYLSMENEIIWNTQTGDVDAGMLLLEYNSKSGSSSFSTQYRFERQDTLFGERVSQLRLHWSQDINSRWSIDNIWEQDLHSDWSIHIATNVRYQGCCFGIEIGWEREQEERAEGETSFLFKISL